MSRHAASEHFSTTNKKAFQSPVRPASKQSTRPEYGTGVGMATMRPMTTAGSGRFNESGEWATCWMQRGCHLWSQSWLLPGHEIVLLLGLCGIRRCCACDSAGMCPLCLFVGGVSRLDTCSCAKALRQGIVHAAIVPCASSVRCWSPLSSAAQ